MVIDAVTEGPGMGPTVSHTTVTGFGTRLSLIGGVSGRTPGILLPWLRCRAFVCLQVELPTPGRLVCGLLWGVTRPRLLRMCQHIAFFQHEFIIHEYLDRLESYQRRNSDNYTDKESRWIRFSYSSLQNSSRTSLMASHSRRTITVPITRAK